MKLYHATSRNYEAGSDLLSLRDQVDAETISESEAIESLISRWEMDEDAAMNYLHDDGALVSFTADLDEARAILASYNGGQGCLLVVDTEDLEADGLRLIRNSEGYPATSRLVPGYLISMLEN